MNALKYIVSMMVCVLFCFGCKHITPEYSDMKINGGVATPRDQVKAVIPILTYVAGKIRPVCTATLIEPDLAISAAHCFTSSVAGSTMLTVIDNKPVFFRAVTFSKFFHYPKEYGQSDKTPTEQSSQDRFHRCRQVKSLMIQIQFQQRMI